MSTEPDEGPEAPAFLVGRSAGELDAALAFLNHKKNSGTSPGRDEAGKVDPAELAAEIRKRMGY